MSVVTTQIARSNILCLFSHLIWFFWWVRGSGKPSFGNLSTIQNIARELTKPQGCSEPFRQCHRSVLSQVRFALMCSGHQLVAVTFSTLSRRFLDSCGQAG
jgi:hypothetical protein